MIQFFRFDKSAIKEAEYRIISGRDSLKFFMKRSVWLILFIYSTLFLAVAVPFVRTPFIPIYFAGSMATTIFLMRFINHIVKYKKFRGGGLKMSEIGIEVTGGMGMAVIKAEDITYLELNLFGNLMIKQKYDRVSFPAALLSDDDREKLYSCFQDMAPGRTKFYRKIWEFIDAIAVALVLAVHIIQYVIQAYYIPTGSMEDTLKIGDHLFVEKITYGPIIPRLVGMEEPVHLSFLGVRKVERGDIVIFRPPHEIDKDYIKRCIA